MAQSDAAVFNGLHHRPDVHANGKPFAGMVDAGDRNGVDGKQGDNSAANVCKCPEVFQMGDLGVDDVARDQAADERLPAFFLRGPAGKQRGCAAVPILLKAGHNEADGPVYAGDDGDVAHRAFANPKGPLIARDNPFDTPQIDEQVVRTVAYQRAPLQNLTRTAGFDQCSGALQCGAVFCRIDQPALGIVFNHFEPSLSLTWLSICVLRRWHSFGRRAAGSFLCAFPQRACRKSDFFVNFRRLILHIYREYTMIVMLSHPKGKI